jgi:hypothetical protein
MARFADYIVTRAAGRQGCQRQRLPRARGRPSTGPRWSGWSPLERWSQISASLRGHIADRYTKATEQLGSDKLDVHLGGIHALERIAVDSK